MEAFPFRFSGCRLPLAMVPCCTSTPYEEIFVIQEGHATFTIGESTIEVDGGHVVLGPAGVPHKFINSGEGTLRQITIHPSKEVITEWLED